MTIPVKKQNEDEAGFTLIELIVVMVIIATMVAFAVPAYQRKIMSGRLEEAKAMIMAIEARQKIYYNQNGEFYGGNAQNDPIGDGAAGDDEFEIRKKLGVDLRESRNFCYELWRGQKGTFNPPDRLNNELGGTEYWFRVRAVIQTPNAVSACKGTNSATASDNMTLQPEWTTAAGSGKMTDANNYLIYEYPHRTAAAYAGGADELAEKGWGNGYNALNIYDQTVDTADWAY
ncbi:type IV pilin protein [Thermodesulfobacteriota bacterium]